ncbi:MAG: DUF1592 domain-containing protein [Bryobacteraceae bacterium]|nr:DUF1592 domain-containing protein [Bryobacteraceae bacterium]
MSCLTALSLNGQTPGFEGTVRPFLTKNCVACHNASVKSGELNLVPFRDPASLDKHNTWETIVHKLKTGEMPPKGVPRPKQPEVDAVASWLEAELERREQSIPPDPGRVTARRLNRTEYNNTIRDLLNVPFRPADDFPADDAGYGFDNIGDVLSLSPVLMEKYLAAAEKIARKALGLETALKPTAERYKAEYRPQSPLFFRARHYFPQTAEYEIRAGAGGQKEQRFAPVTLELLIDGRQAGLYSIDTDGEYRKPAVLRITVPEGEHVIAARLESTAQDGSDPRDRSKNMVVDHVEVRGPFRPAGMPSTPLSYGAVFTCSHDRTRHDAACVRSSVSRLVRRAWRRPVAEAETDRLMKFVEMARAEGDSYETAMAQVLKAILVSPQFLFRIEPDGDRKLNAHEIAARLSYFLWSSMPDAELFRAADEGSLLKPDVLQAQVKRMLADPKAAALAEDFAGQWLQIRNLAEWKPDPEKFPGFDEELRDAMYRETTLLFQKVLREDRSVLEFLDAPYTHLNERLARHYGIPGVEGEPFRIVKLPHGNRGGVLTHASVLTVSSYPTRTSPVMRGKWVLENLLGAPPPPPPANVPALEEGDAQLIGTLRQRMEKHRSNAVCSSCHARMDAIGFGLENYDAVGAWRVNDGGHPIEPAGTLPNGKSFAGPAELKKILLDDKDSFAYALSEKMLTYALGRGLEAYDRRSVKSIAAKLKADDYRFSTLILEVVNSLPFRMRRAERTGTT